MYFLGESYEQKNNKNCFFCGVTTLMASTAMADKQLCHRVGDGKYCMNLIPGKAWKSLSGKLPMPSNLTKHAAVVVTPANLEWQFMTSIVDHDKSTYQTVGKAIHSAKDYLAMAKKTLAKKCQSVKFYVIEANDRSALYVYELLNCQAVGVAPIKDYYAVNKVVVDGDHIIKASITLATRKAGVKPTNMQQKVIADSIQSFGPVKK